MDGVWQAQILGWLDGWMVGDHQSLDGWMDGGWPQIIGWVAATNHWMAEWLDG